MDALGRSDHEFLGSEFDWIARDRQGNLGYFSTAGEGWVPESILANAEPFAECLDIVTALPVVGVPECTFSGDHAIDDWLKVAARGLYALDWNRGTERYELVARPTAKAALEGRHAFEELTRIAILPCSFQTDFVCRGATT
jgi:hypothetical protein